ncbi:MAG: alpha-glucan family phosphorylase [Candidatus Omnitrophica bacterium]|nr:alpha-glucan family phosphorylase [Candidatus Omnitrophota bacterium]
MKERTVAYFSMEIALEPQMPTYSGGLGVLAGDTVRSAADLQVPMVAVSLLHRKGYFSQKLDAEGWQTEEPVQWKVESFLKEMPQRVDVNVEGRAVQVRAWRYEVRGASGFVVPVYLLDTDLPENSEQDQTLTDFLYGGDSRYRLCQEAVLGIGGVRILRALGCERILRFHMNEGHASLLTLALLEERAVRGERWAFGPEEIEAVRKLCVFTTHTPLPAGHDEFPVDLAVKVLGHPEFKTMPEVLLSNGNLNLTRLALNLSRYVNGVSMRHGETSRRIFSTHAIEAITNGVHALTWTAAPFQKLFDRHVPGWKQDNLCLRVALNLPVEEVWKAHLECKRELLGFVRQKGACQMKEDHFTIGFARRAAGYKRGDLLFREPNRLKAIASRAGPIQLLFAGKAHPNDQMGKELIQRIVRAGKELQGAVPMCYLENYDMELAKRMTAGVDLWLNTPQPPLEASGTSGMKAALNGVPSLSTLDGWWMEGHIEGVTGWSIGEEKELPPEERAASDAASLYDKLEKVILPLFYRQRESFIRVMVHAIAFNGSCFNTQRMVQQYVLNAYFRIQ